MPGIKKSSRFISIILALLALFALIGAVFLILRDRSAPPEESGVWFNHLRGVKPLGEAEGQGVAAYIFARIRNPDAAGEPPAALAAHASPSIVFM